MNQPDKMPQGWNETIEIANVDMAGAERGDSDHIKARNVSDYLAGMTDRFALKLYDECCK